MPRYPSKLLFVLAVAVAAAACQPLPPTTAAGSPIPIEQLTRGDMVPAAWGSLVAVSSVGQYPDLVQLWFQDDAKVVRIVVLRTTTMEILHARAIRRD